MTLYILPDGLLDPADIKNWTARSNARLVYHIIWDSDRPMCFDEIEREAQRLRSHEENIDPALAYLTENDFIARTQRNGIVAYDLRHRVAKPVNKAA